MVKCYICKQRDATDDHHVYLYDDGGGNRAMLKNLKYPKWLVPLCHACNVQMGQINKLIKIVLLHEPVDTPWLFYSRKKLAQFYKEIGRHDLLSIPPLYSKTTKITQKEA